MNYFKWDDGRLNGGYQKMLLARSERFKFDLYLLRFPKGSEAKLHTDPALPGYEHHRINVVIKPATIGGKIYTVPKDSINIEAHPLAFKFRPDLVPHMVSLVYAGTMYILSFGYLKESK